MKKLLLLFIFSIFASTIFAQNEYKYPIYMYGGYKVGSAANIAAMDQIDSIKVVGDSIAFYTGATPYYASLTGGQTGGSGSSPLTTKGDVYTYSTVDARLPVGADGTVLTANSAETTGLEWATAGNVTKVGTPLINQIGVWTGDGTIKGDSEFIWLNNTLYVYDASGAYSLHVTNSTVKPSDVSDEAPRPLYLFGSNNSSTNAGWYGGDLYIKSGNQTGASGGARGGNIYMYGGSSVSGSSGQIYFGTGGVGALVNNESAANLVGYNSTTGLLEYRTVAGLAGSGDVTKVGTPVNNQVGVWTGDGTIEGTSALQFDGTSLTVGTASVNQTELGIIDGKTLQTTITDSDVSIPTSGAVVDYALAKTDTLQIDFDPAVFDTTYNGAKTLMTVSIDLDTKAWMLADTVVLGAFSAVDSFNTSFIYGSFYNAGSDTLVVTEMMSCLQGTTPSITVDVEWHATLGSGSATGLNTTPPTITSTTTGDSDTTFDNAQIPPGVFVWLKTPTVTTAPNFMTVTLLGYRLNRTY